MAEPVATEWWASESFWRKCAIFVTAFMAVVLLMLTYHTLTVIAAGSEAGRVPAYSVINHRIGYEFDDERDRLMPVIGPRAPLFGEELDEDRARALVDHGKLTVQARNCMNCHTLLGNGAYYAPDLTKAWLDPGWGNEQARELLMTMFLKDPVGQRPHVRNGAAHAEPGPDRRGGTRRDRLPQVDVRHRHQRLPGGLHAAAPG